ncbi:hypothetical protein LFYK43_14100 [Ligilactobacillus salitolerans]|uniref:Phage protein n=1 Tax=Ligilactobacillus salitolerans TaxID=1808352 RepID=A0A401ITT6_9LACO|nr:ATP-binding protein [Ligilactobacillus salitolerans]GBG94951.1 hypothetical protein LFYK43_14100 [Ligilactobacillus salitolerans]
MNITSGKIPKAQKVVLYGVEGIGKTTFASQFPDPVFIDTENSTDYLDVKRYDKPTSWQMLLNEVQDMKLNRPGKTLVIDTTDWAEDLCKKALCAQHNWKAIDSSDYGVRYVALGTEMGNLLDKLSEVIDAGINVVITAHAWLRKKEEPDEVGSYDRYELKLEKKTAPIVKEWADTILFANYKTYVVETKNKSKKGQGGARTMYTTHRPTWDAKNRWNLADELPFEYKQIAAAFDQAFTGGTQQSVQTQQPEQPPLPPETPTQSAQQPPEETQTAQVIEIDNVIPQGLADLMKIQSVTEDELMQIIYQGGFMPQDTPLENVPQSLFEYITSNWDAALNLLNNKVRN